MKNLILILLPIIVLAGCKKKPETDFKAPDNWVEFDRVKNPYPIAISSTYNICLGRNAGYHFTNESYQLVIRTEDFQLQATMTPKEHEVIKAVIIRAKRTDMVNKRLPTLVIGPDAQFKDDPNSGYFYHTKLPDGTWITTRDPIYIGCQTEYPLKSGFSTIRR